MAGWDDVFRLPLRDNKGSLKTIFKVGHPNYDPNYIPKHMRKKKGK